MSIRDGEKKTPVMIHRAICGSMERFLGILIENYAGHFPLWFAPVQVMVTTITSDADDYAEKVHRTLVRAGLRAEVDLRNEKINYKVREHSLAKVPVILVCGKREAEEGTVNVRRLGAKEQTSMTLAEALTALQQEAEPPDVKRLAVADAAESKCSHRTRCLIAESGAEAPSRTGVHVARRLPGLRFSTHRAAPRPGHILETRSRRYFSSTSTSRSMPGWTTKSVW